MDITMTKVAAAPKQRTLKASYTVELMYDLKNSISSSAWHIMQKTIRIQTHLAELNPSLDNEAKIIIQNKIDKLQYEIDNHEKYFPQYYI